MIVDESLAAGLTQAVLVEEQIPQTVVDEGAVQELHTLRLVCLAATDNVRAGLRHLAEILLLVWLRVIPIIFQMLKSSDHKIAI